MDSKKILLERYIKKAVRKVLKEKEEQQKQADKSMYLIHRFPGLKETLTNLMSSAYGKFISNVSITAPKPTTFSIDLINGENFTITYIGRGNFRIKILGRKYDPQNIGELERASQSLADVLSLNYPPAGVKEPQEQGGYDTPQSQDIKADLAAAGEIPSLPPTGETTPEEPETPSGDETEEAPPEEEI